MKRLLFLLIFISEIAYSDSWIRVASIDGYVLFVDSLSIKRTGDIVTFWSRMNYGIRDSSGNLSSKSKRKINCMTREVKSLDWIIYDDFNNLGKSTRKFSNKSWQPLVLTPINEAMLRFVCKEITRN
jgi:hypothetical protein